MDKCKATWLKIYGYEQPNKNPEQALKGLKKSLSFRQIVIDGRTIQVQGSYEEELLYKLVEKFGLKNVYSSFDLVAKKARRRLGINGIPDFYIKSLDTFIECKSLWTLLGPNNLKSSLEKAKANRGKCIWFVRIEKNWVQLKGKWWLSNNLPSHITFNHYLQFGETLRKNFEDSVTGYLSSIDPSFYVKNHCVYYSKYRVAIDLRTLYFDSTATRDKATAASLIKDRVKKAKSKGWRLITVWDYIWRTHRGKRVIRQLIGNTLGMSKASVFARKCSIEIKNVSDVKALVDNNHIQGSPRTGKAYCLVYEGEVVACMIFDTTRSNRGSKKVKDVYELTRYVTSTRVPGGASKLLKAFIRDMNPRKIISYSDNQMFNGDMYETLGFVNVSESKPGYKVWFGSLDVRPMQSTTRENLAKTFAAFDPTLSEWENCKLLNLHRIYDAGKLKWELSMC
jgi:hypothetical protein